MFKDITGVDAKSVRNMNRFEQVNMERQVNEVLLQKGLAPPRYIEENPIEKKWWLSQPKAKTYIAMQSILEGNNYRNLVYSPSPERQLAISSDAKDMNRSNSIPDATLVGLSETIYDDRTAGISDISTTNDIDITPTSIISTNPDNTPDVTPVSIFDLNPTPQPAINPVEQPLFNPTPTPEPKTTFEPTPPDVPVVPVIAAPYTFSGFGGSSVSKTWRKRIQLEIFGMGTDTRAVRALGINVRSPPESQIKFYRTVGKGKIAEVTKSENDKIRIVDHSGNRNNLFTMPSVRMPSRRIR